MITEPLTVIINQCLRTGIFPENLKVAEIIPLFKRGDPSLIENYRPISLFPAISKVFEKVIHNQLSQYFVSNKLFYENQYGSRKQHSTELTALHLMDNIIQNMDMGKITISVFLDLSKAFDTLDHTILLEKLKFYGICGNEVKLFKNYLTNRQQYVQFDSTKSSFENILTGVPQGSILSLLLFVKYITDISSASTFFKMLIYADDTTLYKSFSVHDMNNIRRLSHIINLELKKVITWLNLNKLSINVPKSKYIIFHVPQRKINFSSLEIEDIAITYVEQFSFLGITLDKHVNWNAHTNNISNRISSVIGIINRIKQFVPPAILKTIYNSLILPHLHYGILLWGLNSKRIFKLQTRAIRAITCSKLYNLHTEPLLKILNTLKLEDILTKPQFKFLYRLLNDNVPFYFRSMLLGFVGNSHNYVTRQKNNLRVPQIKHEFAKKCFRHCIMCYTIQVLGSY